MKHILLIVCIILAVEASADTRQHPLAVVIEWKYGIVADTKDEKITAWRHPTISQPSDTQLQSDDAEYDAFFKRQKQQATAKSAERKQALARLRQLAAGDDKFEKLLVILERLLDKETADE